MPLGLVQRRVLLVAGDLLVSAVVALVALRLGALRSGWPWSPAFVWQHAAWLAMLSGLWVALAAANGMYDVRRAPDRWASAVLSVKVSAQMLLLWALAYFVPPPWTVVRHVVVFFSLGAAACMPLWRQVYAALLRSAAFRRRLLVVGAGRAGRELVTAIRSESPHDFELLGFVDDDPELESRTVEGLPVVADRTGLAVAAQRLGVTDLALAIPSGAHGDMLAAVLAAREGGVTVAPMAVLYEEVTGRVPVQHVGDQWAVALPLDGPGSRGFYPLVKRLLDVALSLLGIVLLAVVLVPAAPAVRLSSRGPVFYRQRRVGRGGSEFTLLKLRTMVAEAEADGPMWATSGDPRVTPAGRWLRRTRIDELPQVFNVLRGDMSVVGPRPERPEFAAELARAIPFYRARNAVRPGLTGWATVHEGYASSTEDALLKLQRDLYYIKHQSLVLDVYIMARTVGTIVRLRGR
jgi:exopolysaccharide biosynthesis polyprenyl glycosylphosphotransferase